ncbi:MAG TPA: hypothetical protein VJK54_11680, partial [Chthoniobacterales bacterium]|nr:hypothetical protein [Chthoniobacterales bacterium]
EEVAKIEAARLQAEDKSDLATAALKEAQKLTTTKTKSVRAVAWNNALTLAKRAAEAWDEIVLLNRGQESKAAKMDKPTWRKALNNAENQAARWNARVIWREANKLQDEVISAQIEAQDIEQGSDQSIKDWSEVLELAQQAEGLLLQTVEIYKTNSKKALNEFKSDWNQAFQQAENKTKSWKEEVQKIREQKMRAETAKVVKAEYEEAQRKREGLWQEAIHQKEAVFAAQADAEKTKEGTSESVVAWGKVLALAQQAETSKGEVITFVQEISKNIDKKFQSDWMTSFSQIEREKSQWTDEIIKIAEKKNQSEALLEREKAKKAAAEKAALEKTARETQEAAEKAAKIQEAQTAWNSFLGERSKVSEKKRSALRDAARYIEACNNLISSTSDWIVAAYEWVEARQSDCDAIVQRNTDYTKYTNASEAYNKAAKSANSTNDYFIGDRERMAAYRYSEATRLSSSMKAAEAQFKRSDELTLSNHSRASSNLKVVESIFENVCATKKVYDNICNMSIVNIDYFNNFFITIQQCIAADAVTGAPLGKNWMNNLAFFEKEKDRLFQISSDSASWKAVSKQLEVMWPSKEKMRENYHYLVAREIPLECRNRETNEMKRFLDTFKYSCQQVQVAQNEAKKQLKEAIQATEAADAAFEALSRAREKAYRELADQKVQECQNSLKEYGRDQRVLEDVAKVDQERVEKKNESEALLEREKAKQAAAEKAALEKTAREAQEAAAKAAKIQEAQTAWNSFLGERSRTSEKKRLALRDAERYFEAINKAKNEFPYSPEMGLSYNARDYASISYGAYNDSNYNTYNNYYPFVDSCFILAQQCAAIDKTTGVFFQHNWTDTLAVFKRERDAWERIIDAPWGIVKNKWGSAVYNLKQSLGNPSFNESERFRELARPYLREGCIAQQTIQKQLKEAIQATQAADAAFEALSRAQDAAYAVIDQSSSQQQQKALEKSQSAKLKAPGNEVENLKSGAKTSYHWSGKRVV